MRPPRERWAWPWACPRLFHNNTLNEIWIFDLSRPLALYALTDYVSVLWVLDVVVSAEALLDVCDLAARAGLDFVSTCHVMEVARSVHRPRSQRAGAQWEMGP